MLQDLYSAVEVYREADRKDDWGNTSKRANYVYHHNENGYIQPRGGNFANVNQSNVPINTAILYAAYDVDILINDRVKQNGLSYQVTFVPPVGIASISDHQEISCIMINDVSL